MDISLRSLVFPLNSDLDYSSIALYRSQYDQAKTAWEATDNDGPDASKCQYYQGSNVPIFVITGEGSYSGGKSLLPCEVVMINRGLTGSHLVRRAV